MNTHFSGDSWKAAIGDVTIFVGSAPFLITNTRLNIDGPVSSETEYPSNFWALQKPCQTAHVSHLRRRDPHPVRISPIACRSCLGPSLHHCRNFVCVEIPCLNTHTRQSPKPHTNLPGEDGAMPIGVDFGVCCKQPQRNKAEDLAPASQLVMTVVGASDYHPSVTNPVRSIAVSSDLLIVMFCSASLLTTLNTATCMGECRASSR